MNKSENRVDWGKYQSALSDYDILLKSVTQISEQLVGIIPDGQHLQYAEQILVKTVAHCVTLRQLLPNPDTNAAALWDLASISAVARSIVETYDALAYIALEEICARKRAFRILLWEYHDNSRRVKMLSSIGSKDAKFVELQTTTKTLKSKVIRDQQFTFLSKGYKDRIQKDDPPPYLLSQRERCTACRVDYDYYNFITMQLSQYVHTYPFSIHQLFHFRAGSQEALNLMIMPIQFTLPFLARVIEGMLFLFPGKCSISNSVATNSIQLWSGILVHGFKNAPSRYHP